ncbi:MAG: hypothetical protein JWM48_1837 [Mycobacterium sp.]|nr:hypothetical protein [Mycobacterium sp.]
MLRRFLYLDTASLYEYVAALEGGALTDSVEREVRRRKGGGGLDAKLVKASGEAGSENELTQSRSDTDAARFDRLLKAAAVRAESLGWVEVADPDTDFLGIGIGAMVSWECDLYIPQLLQAFSKSGEAAESLAMIRDLLPIAQELGLETAGIPDIAKLDGMAAFLAGVSAKTMVVGEDDPTDWRIAAHLQDDYIRGSLEGRARIVGKVTKIIGAEQWMPFLALPGMNLISRTERRRLERQAPTAEQADNYLNGPALILDLLAIFR